MLRWASPTTGLRLRIPGALSVAAPLLLAGLLPLASETSERWGWSGAWLHPVGEPYTAPRAPSDTTDRTPGYRAVRGIREAARKQRGHDGADLSNGSGGGPVRAAGNGLVVKVGDSGWNRGYGRHIVIAHRLADGALVYSVYAHLAPGPATVKRGDFVGAGRVLGKVGMTGRATSPHLHFEVRAPVDLLTRWENAPAVDPVAFVAARLPANRADSLWSRPYLEWAECAGLVRSGDEHDEGDRRATRADWWRALLLATRNPLASVPASGESLRAAIIGLGLLPEGARDDPDRFLRWEEMSRDVPRVRALGMRVPWSPVTDVRRREDCSREFWTATPAQKPDSLSGNPAGGPTRAQMCLVLADLAGDPPPRPKKTKRRPRGPTPAG